VTDLSCCKIVVFTELESFFDGLSYGIIGLFNKDKLKKGCVLGKILITEQFESTFEGLWNRIIG
jgi:hypothetical protein